VVVTTVLLLLSNLGAENFGLELPFNLLTTLIAMTVLLRWGVLALALTFFTSALLDSFPITLDLSNWYASRSLFMLAILLALLFYGVRLATGNRPLLEQ
jgi:hypothetical protein